MRILVAGCGYVGTALGLQFAADGHDVFGLRRDPTGLPDAITPLAADLLDPDSLTDLPGALDKVALTVSPDGRGEDAYRAAYVDGPALLLEALRHQEQAPRIVFTSSTAVYGQDDGSWVDENSPTEPARYSGRILLDAEAQVLDWPDAAVLRLTGIYGPGRTRLLDSVRAGSAVCVEGTTSYTNRIHRDDAASALAHLLTTDDPNNVYIGVDDDPADRCAMLQWLARRLGVAPPEYIQADDPRAPKGRGGNKRCSNARLRASGWSPMHPTYRSGYAEMIDG